MKETERALATRSRTQRKGIASRAHRATTLWAIASLVWAGFVLVGDAKAEEPESKSVRADIATSTKADAMTLARAIEGRLTIWETRGGKPIHVRHCRDAREGCRARIATFARWIVRIAKKHDLDPFVLAAIAMRESGFNPSAQGAVGERGIVQLHPKGVGRAVRYVRSEAYRDRCKRSPGACQQEVLEVGAKHVSDAIKRCGSVEAGLGAYNSGHCGTTEYTEKVMSERELLLEHAKRDSASKSGA